MHTKKIIQILTVFMFVVLVVGESGGPIIFAQEHPEHPSAKGKEKTSQIAPASAKLPQLQKGQLLITGVIGCSACDAGKKGANSKCHIYGHSQYLKTSDVKDSDGKILSNFSGKNYNILANDKGSLLLNEKYLGKEFIIVGNIYSEENLIDIDFVKFKE